MSRATPRRNRQGQSRNTPQGHTRNPSGSRALPVSDYESDAAHYLDTVPSPPPSHLPHRTNTELNLGVLRRYVPSITSIISIAANAVIYTFDVSAATWDKSGVEGTLFVCLQEPNPATGEPRFCVFVLNRRGLENMMLDLGRIRECEVTNDLLILALEDGDRGGGREVEEETVRTLGIWMHEDNTDTRQVNMNIIHGLWEQVREAKKQVQAAGYGDALKLQGRREESVGPAVQAIGKPLSIDELFASQTGGGYGG